MSDTSANKTKSRYTVYIDCDQEGERRAAGIAVSCRCQSIPGILQGE